jgi:Ca2+-binding RTX toxin-like protein
VNNRYQTIVDSAGQDCIDLSSLSESMHVDLGRDVGALLKVGVVTTMTGWTNMHLGSDPNSLSWLYGDFEDAIGGSGHDELFGSHLGNALTGGFGDDILNGAGGMDRLVGGRGADSLTGGTESDTFVFSAQDSGQAIAFDVITDYSKGQRGTGDLLDYTAALTPGGSAQLATSNQALISSSTGVATFAANSGTAMADALADIAARFTAAGDSAGEFAFFQVNREGNYYMLISDGIAGVTANDVVIQLVGVTSISQIDLNQGNLTIVV